MTTQTNPGGDAARNVARSDARLRRAGRLRRWAGWRSPCG
ncbi:hypothetical protein C7S15_6234 [Burkholderia cepacia]|nr:hypothetical protein [Burkholderia cepacia]